MLSHNYSYQQCLDNSKKVAWIEEDVIKGRNFDFTRMHLPDRLVGADAVSCLDADEKRILNHIAGNSYCHLFAFVEEFIIALIMQHAHEGVYRDEVRLRSLVRFVEDEIKHQELFRRSMELFASSFSVECGVIPDREGIAEVVLGKSRLCALLLTSMLEWLTQAHYLEHVRDTSGLDELFGDLLKYHWLDEAQHAKIDSLLMDELAPQLSLADREKAIDELLELVGAFDGLLRAQSECNLESLGKATGRTFSEEEQAEILTHAHNALRWGFLVVGLEHPKFTEIVGALTEGGTAKLSAAAKTYSAQSPSA